MIHFCTCLLLGHNLLYIRLDEQLGAKIDDMNILIAPAGTLRVFIVNDFSRNFNQTSGDLTCVCMCWVGLGCPLEASDPGDSEDGSPDLFVLWSSITNGVPQ